MLANQTGKKSCKRLASSMYTNLSGFSSTMVLLLTSLTRPPGRSRGRSMTQHRPDVPARQQPALTDHSVSFTAADFSY